MSLGDFLKREAASADPWNCSTAAADWCVSLGYPDFCAKWREITDYAECEATSAGCLLQLWDEGIGASLPIAQAPYLAGDIAVISLRGHEAGAVFTGQRWALRKPHGLMFVPLDSVSVVKAWRP